MFACFISEMLAAKRGNQGENGTSSPNKKINVISAITRNRIHQILHKHRHPFESAIVFCTINGYDCKR